MSTRRLSSKKAAVGVWIRRPSRFEQGSHRMTLRPMKTSFDKIYKPLSKFKYRNILIRIGWNLDSNGDLFRVPGGILAYAKQRVVSPSHCEVRRCTVGAIDWPSR